MDRKELKLMCIALSPFVFALWLFCSAYLGIVESTIIILSIAVFIIAMFAWFDFVYRKFIDNK